MNVLFEKYFYSQNTPSALHVNVKICSFDSELRIVQVVQFNTHKKKHIIVLCSCTHRAVWSFVKRGFQYQSTGNVTLISIV